MNFLQPLFLAGTALSVVPVIIHLWYRKRLSTVQFSTLAFLKKTEARRFGWLRLREIIILALRCLFIGFLFIGLAKPQLVSTVFGVGRLASVVCIVDNSYSIAYGANFDSVKTIASTIVSAYSPNSEFLLLPLCMLDDDRTDSSAVIRWIPPNAARTKLRSLALSYHTSSIREAWARVPHSDARYGIEYIYVGDGQERNFVDFPEELTTGNFQWVKIPMGSNVGISSVKVVDPVSLPLDNYTLQTTVRNYSPKGWQGKVVLSTGEYHFEEQCEVRGHTDCAIDFLLPTSLRRGEVRFYDDSLTIDNIYFFSKSLPHRLKVLVVGENPFLVQALTASEGNRSPFVCNVARDLTVRDIRDYNVVILDGLTELSEAHISTLANFLDMEDRGVLVFLGENIGPHLRSYIEPLASVETLVIPKGYLTLDWIDINHPVFMVYPEYSVLKNTKFYKYHQILPHGHTIAKLTGGAPLIVVKDNRALITTQFLPRTTDIIYKTSFIPLLYRLTAHSAVQHYDNELLVGDSVPHERLKAPLGAYLVKGTTLTQPGFYTEGNDTIGVNVVAQEGDAKTLGKEAARALGIRTIDPYKQGTRDLSSIFLLAALAAFLLELVLLLAR